MKAILTAVDGSKPSGRAVQLAADIALRFGAEVTLINVLEPLWIPTISGDELAQVDEDRRKEARKLLSDTERTLAKPGLKIHRVVMEGSVAEAVSQVASSQKFDLVVVGSRGRGATARMLLGSVSDRLAHICEQPILIVH